MSEERVTWKSLPPLRGGVWVAMVTEVLDQKEIPNIVKTDLSSGGLGQVTGTEQLGKGWRIQVPEESYAEALDIFESLMGEDTPGPEERL
ncbi:hypothetical protein KKG66_00385 [bacterium]|nr:hypothetical protein [bacterium]MBU1919273.1 hypothetical protein [bacterium]RQV98873.1 MAG: hypothetical protein EH220_02650 [bacterium]